METFGMNIREDENYSLMIVKRSRHMSGDEHYTSKYSKYTQ